MCPLLLPSKGHFLRRLIDESCPGTRRAQRRLRNRVGFVARCGGHDGLGSTILSASVAAGASSFAGADIRRLVRPVIEATVSLCTSIIFRVGTRSGGPIGPFDVVEKLMRKHPQDPDGAISKVYSGRPHLCWLAPAASRTFNITGFPVTGAR